MRKHLLVLFVTPLLLLFSVAFFSGPAGAQQRPTQAQATRELPWTGILIVEPVDCAVMGAPVVGFEISKGQSPDDALDFLNDLALNGFSVGTVDLDAGPIPTCVDVLIVPGLAGNLALSPTYSPAEGALLQSWVASGHGLLLAGDWGFLKDGTQALFQAFGSSQLGDVAVGDPTDFDPTGPGNTWVFYQSDNFAGHPVLNGVTTWELLRSSWLSPTLDAIVTSDPDASPPGAPVMAAVTAGDGCAFLSTDTNWYGVYDGGYLKQDNARVAQQVIAWLNGCGGVGLTKSATPNPVQAGGFVTFTLTATGYYTPALTNVRIVDRLPDNTTFVTATLPHVGPDANRVITWSVGALRLNASAGVTLVVQVDALLPDGAVITNTA